MNEEIWKPVVGHEGWYEVSNLGRVRRCTILKPQVIRGGYLYVNLKKRCKSTKGIIHSMVLKAFVGPRGDDKVCRHKDGVRTNNSLINLEWGTQKENISDKKKHGTHFMGATHHNSVLTESEVISIRALARSNFPHVALARRFRVTPAHIGHIVNRRAWNHI